MMGLAPNRNAAGRGALPKAGPATQGATIRPLLVTTTQRPS